MTSFCKNIPPDKCDSYVDCQAVRLQEGDYAAFPELTCNAELLAGEEAAVERAAGRGETWYEWLVARLHLAHRPRLDLAVPGQQAIARFGRLADMTTLDSVLLAALESDAPPVMRELCLTLDDFRQKFNAYLSQLHNYVITQLRTDKPITQLRSTTSIHLKIVKITQLHSYTMA